jgi:NAD(P)-dependent dehydrogenase (short-subunit alcohol dehydrogenase family)
MPMKNGFDLENKVALITGGSRGLGRQMVLAFAQAGADVVIASRKMDACESLAKEIEESTQSKALAYAVNVGNWDELDGLVDAAYQRFGKIDVLVNNAGMSPLYDKLEDVSEALYDKVLNVNLKGPFRLMALVGSRMAQGDGGSIINISSIAAAQPSPGVIPYAAAKSGLEVMTKGFAQAFGPRVRVNAIQAGPFLTDISNAWDMASFEKHAAQRIALERGGEPQEIVGAALYFASEASSFTTGAVLAVDGGDRG